MRTFCFLWIYSASTSWSAATADTTEDTTATTTAKITIRSPPANTINICIATFYHFLIGFPIYFYYTRFHEKEKKKMSQKCAIGNFTKVLQSMFTAAFKRWVSGVDRFIALKNSALSHNRKMLLLRWQMICFGVKCHYSTAISYVVAVSADFPWLKKRK